MFGLVALVCSTLAAASGASGCAHRPAPAPVESLTVYSDAFTIDKMYASMQGPYQQFRVHLGDSTSHELLWVVGYKAGIVDADSRAAMSAEYMCHSNLDIDMERHRELFGWTKYPSQRLFTLSEGQQSVRLPDGFGIPMRADEGLAVTAQVLNQNHAGAPVHVRQRITFYFIRDKALEKPLVPLYQSAANALVQLDGPEGGFGMPLAAPMAGMEHMHHASDTKAGAAKDGDEHAHHSDGMSADNQPYVDASGRKFTGHWIVKPGREVRHTPVNGWLGLRADEVVHFVNVHMHPYGEALELRDLTTGESVFSTHMASHADRVGVEWVEQISLPQGVVLHKDHNYDLVSTYNNTSGQDRTAMAVMYMYLEDREFKRQ